MKTLRLAMMSVLLSLIALGTSQSAPGDVAVERGHALFAGSCAYCHGQKGFATTLLAKRLGAQSAVLETRTDLSPALIRAAVRHGINGMPWYRRSELSDADLDDIVSFLTRQRDTQ